MTQKSTRDRILDAMYMLVAENGYDKASIGQICNEIGVTKPSVYYYFKSKEEIFLEVINNLGAVYHADGLDDVKDAQQFRTFFQQFGIKIISGYKNDLPRRRIMAEIAVQSVRIESFHKYQLEYVRQNMVVLSAIVEKGVSLGAMPTNTDVSLVANLLHSVLIGLSDNVLASDRAFEANKVWIVLVDKRCCL